MRKRILHLVAVLVVLAAAFASTPPARAEHPAAQPLAVDAKIEIVFPHDARGNVSRVAEAPLVNLEVFLFERGTLNPVPCDLPNTVRLRWTRNGVLPTGQSEQTPAHDLPGFPASQTGQRTIRTVGDKVFPSWVFNDVPIGFPTPGADLALSKTFFFVEVDGADTRSNVWSHSADPRTFFPSQFNPPGVATTAPSVVDGMVQVVFPHSRSGAIQPVSDAPLANIAVEVFTHPMGPSVPLGFNKRVRLLQALNDGFLNPVANSQVLSRTVGTLTFPRWEFNDVDVSAANTPGNKYFFAVKVEGAETHTIIWAHGAEARTIFPQVDVPAKSGLACSR